MDQIILSQIPISELEDLFRKVIREERAIEASMIPIKKEDPITRKELCKRLNITPQTCIRWEKKGKIPVFKIGTAIRYDMEKVKKALEK